MKQGVGGRSIVLCDSCVVINLVASGQITEILQSTDRDFEICSAVMRESLYLRPDNPQEQPPDPIKLELLIKSGTLKMCDIDNEKEESLYVDYASQLDDGEAMSLALAEARGHILATDERKARRLFLQAVGSPNRLLSTCEIIRSWADRENVSEAKLKGILVQISRRARFYPAPNDPNFQWWLKSCR